MLKFAANLSMMFTEVPFLDRFAAAADAGFKGVEFLFPYEYSPEAVESKAEAAGVQIILFNMPPGNWASGERGIACIPGREEEFQADVEKALTYAIALGTRRLHSMAGIVPNGADPADCRRTLIGNLQYAAEKLAPYHITLLLEAINTRDIPGFVLSTQKDSFSICEVANAPNLKMQMDLYHMQVMEGDLATKLRNYAPHCGHIQIAGCPGRNEPDMGEVRYEYLFRLLDELGYEGWLGCEYRPAGRTTDGLSWMRSFSEP
ncbi:MAG TPA: 2-oxo-tetronate isomerase [Terracidiphilus sp.]|jgi:hydroxypyruvate isomerase|nr:2-oxo-tetronate isomerase [Terracidiphilus sp.]